MGKFRGFWWNLGSFGGGFWGVFGVNSWDFCRKTKGILGSLGKIPGIFRVNFWDFEGIWGGILGGRVVGVKI